MNTGERIENLFQVLIGLPLQDAGHAGPVHWFSFGAPRAVQDYTGGTRQAGEYALHVQCEWRIVGPDGIVTGSDDRYFPGGADPYNEPPGFDYEVQGSTRLDERMLAFREVLNQNLLIVEQIWADHTGSVRLTLSGGCSLELFPSHTLKYEYWRFFVPGADPDVPHFVITGLGIED
ncbi:MAG: hypothetical protein ABI670_14970 [Chloroflexota bacterium]